VDRDVELGGVLLLASTFDDPVPEDIPSTVDQDSPFENEGALEIQSLRKVPDKKARKYWREAIL
jgi:hypothetical protein